MDDIAGSEADHTAGQHYDLRHDHANRVRNRREDRGKVVGSMCLRSLTPPGLPIGTEAPRRGEGTHPADREASGRDFTDRVFSASCPGISPEVAFDSLSACYRREDMSELTQCFLRCQHKPPFAYLFL